MPNSSSIINQNNNEPHSWQRVFKGRENELDRMKKAWIRVAESGETVVLPILGTAGIGKTRLVQEFYKWLSSEYDAKEPEGYWPDELPITGRSLDFMPNMRRSNVINPYGRPMPFLWWGAAWPDPSGEKLPTETGQGFEGSWHMLHAHSLLRVFINEAKDQEKENLKQALDSLGKTFISAIPGTDLLLNGYSTTQKIIELSKGVLKGQELNEKTKQRMQTALATLDAEYQQKMYTAISMFLNPKPGVGEPIPGVLFLDDPQWARQEDIQLIDRIVRGPVVETTDSSLESRPWPLLVIVTYWPENWNKHKPDEPKKFTTIRDLLSVLPSRTRVKVEEPINLGELENANLRAIIREALQGITEDQLDKLVSMSAGNPRLCTQILFRLTVDHTMFVDQSFANPLDTNRLNRLEAIVSESGIYGVIKDRLATMPDTREVLAASTVQGPNFLTDLVAEIAEHLPIRGTDKAHAVKVHLSNANHPEALTEITGSATYRFPEAIYFRVCNDILRSHAKFHVKLQNAVRNRLAIWITEQRYDQLDEYDAVHLLALASDTLDQNRSDESEAWEQALVHLIGRLQQNRGPTERLHKRLEQLFDARPPREHADSWIINYGYDSIDLIYKSTQRLRPQDSSVISLCMLNHARNTNMDSEQSMSIHSISHDRLGDSLLQTDPKAALFNYQESLKLRRQSIQRYGENADSTNSLAVSHVKIGDVLRYIDPELAITHYQESLRLLRHVSMEYGDDLELTYDTIVSLIKNGDMTLYTKPEASHDFYQESLDLSRQIIEQFGRNYQSLHKLMICLAKVGDAKLKTNLELAIENYSESLKISYEIIQRYGADLNSLRDYTVSLNKISSAICEQDPHTAISFYNESLRHRRGILKHFGESAQSMRDVMTSLHGLGDGSQRVNSEEAIAHYKDALELSRAIIRRFGADAQSMRDLAISEGKLGAAMQNTQLSIALNHFRKALKICQKITKKYKPDEQSLFDLFTAMTEYSRCLYNLAFEQINSDKKLSLANFMESLQIRKEIVRRFEVGPDSKWDIVCGLAMLVEFPGHQNKMKEAFHLQVELIDQYGANDHWIRSARFFLKFRSKWMAPIDEPEWKAWWTTLTGEQELPTE